MNTVAQFMNLSFSNEINMFFAKDFAPHSLVNIVSCRADVTGGAAAEGTEQSLLPSPDARSEEQGVKARNAHQPLFSND